MTAIQWTLLLATLTVCDCQVQSTFCIKPDKCPQEKCCSSNCMTLSEYAIMNSNGTTNSRLELLSPGEYYLNSTFSISGTSSQSFSIIGNGSDSTVINCTQKDAALKFDGLFFLAIEYLSFVSCGVDKLPGVSLTNITTVNLTDTRYSKSTSGALDIQNCSSVQLTNLRIANNLNSRSTLASVSHSDDIKLSGLLVANNSIGTLDSTCAYKDFPQANEVVLRIEYSTVEVNGDIKVLDNIGPFGVLEVSNTFRVSVSGDWRFERNQVCSGGSLAFIKTSVLLNGNLFFIENRGINDSIQHTAGLFQQDSVLNVSGSVEFTGNEGYTACHMSMTSTLRIIEGDLIIQNSSNSSYQSVSLQRDSKLFIEDGSLIVKGNHIRQGIIISVTSTIYVTGEINITNNFISPISVYNSKVILNGKLFFSNNAGILYASKSDINITGDSTFIHNSIQDNYIDGTLAIFTSTLTMDGTYKFKDNVYDDENGGGIFASTLSTVRLGGTGYFIKNTAKNGGGIFIDQLSRLELDRGTRLYFMNNTAIKGAAIFIGTSVHHVECQSNETDCLLKLEDSTDPDVTITFQHNKAYPGASGIHVNFDHIKERNIKYPALMDLNNTINKSSLTIGNSFPLYSSDTYWFCFCEDSSPENCNRKDPPKNVNAFRGKPFPVRARVLKFYGSNMSEPVRANLESSLRAVDKGESTVNASLTANNGRLISVKATECLNFTFSVKSTADHETIIMNVGETFLDIEKSLQINVFFNSSCPPGFPLNDSKDSCECDKSIEKFLESCEITDKKFLKRTEYINYWMAPSNNSAKMNWYSNCPNRYCITNGSFTFSDDGICAKHRSGFLCGQCSKPKYSLLLGGDLCEDCSDKNAHLALILVFAAAGVLLIAFIFLTQITVTTGTINGLIFYANILNSNQSVFFPEGFFRGYHVFIAWLNLNFGIETCFFDGMDQLAYSGLQFVFPLYLWLLAGIVVLLCHFSMRVAKFFGSSDPVAVLATIIFLSFNSLVQNIVGVFYFSNLNLPKNDIMSVWRYDGNIMYFSGNHRTLLLVSTAFVLIFVLPYALVLFSAPLFQKNEHISKILSKMKLQPFIHTYLVPFKPQHRYWAGLCLFMRAFLLIGFAYGEERRVNLFIIAVACAVAISMFFFTGGIYDKSWIDKLEVSFFINLGVLAAAISYSLSNSVNEQPVGLVATYISITVALLTFIGIVILHIFWRLRKFKVVNKWAQKIVQNIKSFKKRKSITNDSVRFSDIDDSVNTRKMTSQVVDLREPLLESLNT